MKDVNQELEQKEQDLQNLEQEMQEAIENGENQRCAVLLEEISGVILALKLQV